jgi:hypothetical protein
MVDRIKFRLFISFIIALSVLMLFFCSKQKGSNISLNNALMTKRTYYPDSVTLEIEMTFKDDSTPHGYGKVFYPSGRLERYIEFTDGNKDGVEIDYYQNGAIKRWGYYKRGKADSTWIRYDSTGWISSKTSMFAGDLVGEQVTYHPNGIVSNCSFFYPSNQITYELNLQENGVVLNEFNKVVPLLIVLTDNKSNVWKIGEEIRAMTFGCPCADNGGLREITLESLSHQMTFDKVSLANSVSRFMYKKILEDTGQFELKVSCWNNSISSYLFIVSENNSTDGEEFK